MAVIIATTGSLFAVIRNRKEVLFDGQIKALTSKNEKGVFDILPEHAQFISLIKDFIIIHKEDGDLELKITDAILKVHENRVDVYVGVEPESQTAAPTKSAPQIKTTK